MTSSDSNPFNQAIDYLQAGDLANALTAIERALTDNPKDVEAWQIYSLILNALGRKEDGEKALAKFQELSSDPVEVLIMQASQATIDGNKKRAISLYEDALEKEESRFELWTNYALVLIDEGYQKDALDATAKALELVQDEAQVWYARGRVLRICSKAEEALEAFDKSIQLEEDYPLSWHERGMVLAGQGQLEEAVKSFDKVLQIVPNDPSAFEAKQVLEQKLP